MGGPGSEREVSLRSGSAVANALSHFDDIEVIELIIQDEHFSLPPETDLAFIAIHGRFGEDGQLQKILDQKGIPYTGAGLESSSLAFNKVRSKQRFIEKGVPTPEFQTFRTFNQKSEQELRYWTEELGLSITLPIVVKPVCEGSSVGVHIVRTREELPAALWAVSRYGSDILLEQYITGRELTVGVLDDDETLPVIEIRPKHGFYSYENKYTSGASDYLIPAPINSRQTAETQLLALAAHRALGIEVYSRIDILMDPNGRLYVLEANTIPGMTSLSLLPQAALQAGYSFPELCKKIAELSLAKRQP